jgi:hypothetical protein
MRDQGRIGFLVAEDIPWLPDCERGSIHSRPAMLSAAVTGVWVRTAANWLRILGKSIVHLRYSQLHACTDARFLAYGVKELDKKI